MKHLFYTRQLILLVCLVCITAKGIGQKIFTLKNENIEVSLNARGELDALVNRKTGHNYASGKPIWRLYYDNKLRKDIEVLASESTPFIEQATDRIVLRYNQLKLGSEKVQIKLVLTLILEKDKVRFSSHLTNNEPHTIVRELQYPLIANCALLPNQQLLTTSWGGQIYKDVRKQIAASNATNPPYYTPSWKFLQMDQKYPTGWGGGGLASNCFAFVGDEEGLYFGSHDTTFTDTGHGLRLYPSRKFVFDQIEAGFYKYPNCLSGTSWKCDANVIAPYSGSWHQTAKLYRTWVNTWWKHKEEPNWIKMLKGWQRIIVKHQYGEVYFPYSDIGSRVKKVGEAVGLNAVLIHGWHKGGHDNDYPNYVTDPNMGGDAVLKQQIAAFQKGGGAVLLYYSGRLIDKASEYYKKGEGKIVAVRDNTGTEVSDAYRFRGSGTFTGSYDSRTFTVSEFRHPKWKKKLTEMADQAIGFGAKSVFYDQMGWGDAPNWDLSKEFPIPNMKTAADKSKLLGYLHDYIDRRDTSVAIGIELLADVTAMQVDYIHSRYGATEVLNADWEQRGEKPRTTNFIDWFRYTFPEIIMSDRDIRDDTDIERRVNHTVLKGLRNDVEIYRARALVDETPHYQQYLTKVNALKDQYAELLLLGTYRDTEGFGNSNAEIEARAFTNKDRLALVVTQSHLLQAKTKVSVPGYQFEKWGSVGDIKIENVGEQQELFVPKHGLAVLIYKKTSNN